MKSEDGERILFIVYRRKRKPTDTKLIWHYGILFMVSGTWKLAIGSKQSRSGLPQ